MRRVVVTGLGIISPLGLGVKQTWQSLLLGRSGISALTSPEFASLQCKVAGLIPRKPPTTATATTTINNDSEPQQFYDPTSHLTPPQIRTLPPHIHYTLHAVREALLSALWAPTSLPALEATGSCIGTGIGSLSTLYTTSLLFSRHGSKRISPHFVPQLLANLASGTIALEFGFQGPSHAVSTACTTGAHSIGDAMRFIQHGDAQVMLAGGAEACIHPLAIAGFERSKSLCVDSNAHPEMASRPFDTSRSGFVMSEGAGVMVLEEAEHALARGAEIYAELVGYAATCDAWHVTQPEPSGGGAYRSMKRALEVAGVKPGEVSWVNAHATGTRLGDKAEVKAISRLVLDDSGGDTGARGERVCVSSTKGATGHLLGAAGAVEACFSVLAIRDGIVPGTLNLEDLDLDVDIDGDGGLDFVRGAARERDVDVVLTNSFGFGGTNATLCFRRWRG